MQRRFTLPTILGSLLVVIIFSAAAFLRAATPGPDPAGSGYHVIKTIPIGGEGGWDYVYVDSDARRVYVSRGTHVVVVDADTYAVVGDIPDTQGVHGIAVASNLYHLDAQSLKELHHWPLARCKSPSGLAMDVANRRLFSVCDEKVMSVVNADTGKVVGTPTICEGPDAAGFDPSTGYAFASCGDGNLTVIREDSPDKFTVVENIPTKRSARTMGLDLKTHNIFLPAADFDPPAPGERRGKMKPGS